MRWIKRAMMITRMQCVTIPMPYWWIAQCYRLLFVLVYSVVQCRERVREWASEKHSLAVYLLPILTHNSKYVRTYIYLVVFFFTRYVCVPISLFFGMTMWFCTLKMSLSIYQYNCNHYCIYIITNRFGIFHSKSYRCISFAHSFVCSLFLIRILDFHSSFVYVRRLH